MDRQTLLMLADAIQRKKLIRITFRAKEDGQERIRLCAPLDLSPSERANNKFYKYHVWNMDSLPNPHILSLSPEQIIHIEVTEESFIPEQIVTWKRKKLWTIVRDWGSLS